jgi:hypothetical protein
MVSVFPRTYIKSGRQACRPWFHSALALLAVLCVAGPAGAAPQVTQEYPKLGGIQIGVTPYDGITDPAYHKQIARLDLAILGNVNAQMTEQAHKIKDINPKILLAHYFNLTAILADRGGYYTGLSSKLSSEKGPNNTNAKDWWLRDMQGNFISGATAGMQRTNLTEYVKADSNGDKWPEFKAKYDYDWMMSDPVWDIWFQDVVSWEPKFQGRDIQADWSGGRVTSGKELGAAWRRGHQAHWKKLRQLKPGSMIIGNHNWYLYQENFGKWDLVEYDKQIEGGVLEAVMGWSGRSIEATKGWATLRKYYGWTMSYMRDPKLVIFNVRGDPNDYQFFRYAFATCLMDDGFFSFSDEGTYQYGTVEWFDEYDLAGSGKTNWMGRAVSGPQVKPWKNGVIRRDFENAVVLVNPRGNGAVTVTVENGLSRIAGKQDRVVNNGQAAGSIKLQDGDGIVLVRNSAAKAPNAPAKPPVLSPIQ